ncbi:MAG: hypothetical protein CVV44_16895 [Spirochaetae bacterium HGW-Spirochaetae-1]|jgi:hypothetical protein|nr:MAG: hypothetical protein CVV44_16895 [Spirochaetae bacterium HGW-Spirochaetae-1]
MIFLTAVLPAASAAEKNDEVVSYEAAMEDVTGEKGWQYKMTGQYKDLFTYQKVDEYYGTGFFPSGEKGLAANLKRLRLSPEVTWGTMLLLHVDYDNEIMVSSYTGSHEFDAYWRPSEYNDFLDLSWDPHYSNDLYYRMKLHRAYVRLNTGDFSFTLGRQQIRFGSGRLWNPLDILNPISPTFVEGAEEQKGTDALRADWFFTSSSELSLVVNPVLANNRYGDMKFQNCNYVARAKTSIKETDVALLGGWISHRGVAGIDGATTFFDGMLRGSVLYSNPEDYDYYVQASMGYEYTFSFGLYLLAEYFFNQNGLNYNADLKNAYAASLISGMSQSGYNLLANQFLTANRHYLGFVLGYDIHPLVRDDFFIIIDFEGRAAFINESLKFNAMENMDITAGLMFAFTGGGTDKISDFESFTGDNLLYYISLSLYF